MDIGGCLGGAKEKAFPQTQKSPEAVKRSGLFKYGGEIGSGGQIL